MTESTPRNVGDAATTKVDAPPQPALHPVTVIAVGGLVMCVLVVLQDPVARTNCLRVARERRVHQAILRAVKWVGRETAIELEGRS